MGLVLRAVGGCVAVACALSLSGAALQPEPVRAGTVGSAVASVTTPGLQDGQDVPPVEVEVTGPAAADATVEDLSGPDGYEIARLGPGENVAIPERVLEAYQAAAERIGRDNPSCNLRWEILAGIGKVESGHANGGRLNADGEAVPHIIGPVLNGVGPVAAIRDTDNGRWDGDQTWDRAVGPMQFIPGTWRGYGVDGSGDGVANPHNVWDATLSAGRYLCAGGADLSTDAGLRSALLRYNRSTAYVNNVLRWIEAYTSGASITSTGSGPGSPSAGESGGSGSGSGGSASAAPGSRSSAGGSGPSKESGPSRTIQPSKTSPPASTPTKTKSPKPSPTSTETKTPEPDPTETKTPKPTPTETKTPKPTPTETKTPKPTPTKTPKPTPTETKTPEPDPTETKTPKPTPTKTPKPTPTKTPKPTPSPDPEDSEECPDPEADEGDGRDDESEEEEAQAKATESEDGVDEDEDGVDEDEDEECESDEDEAEPGDKDSTGDKEGEAARTEEDD